jgi:Tfp pilus assembly protein FimT
VRNQRRGYTLYELVLVVAVLMVAALLVAPTLQTLAGATPINAAADTVKARMAQARARAMAENRPYRFDVMDNTGTMRIAPDSDEFWDGGSGSTMASTDSSSSQPPLVLEDKLPKEIRFCGAQSLGSDGQPQASGSSGGWVCPVVFLPNGTTRQDAEIAFMEAGGKPLVIRVTSSTGAITTLPR